MSTRVVCFLQALEEISLQDRNLQLETLKSDLHTVMEAISQSSAKQTGEDVIHLKINMNQMKNQ